MSRRDMITMNADERREMLEECRSLQIATINPDGAPNLVTMWYALDGDDIVFWTYATSQKVKNLERDPRICCLVEDGTAYEELRGIQINGEVDIVSEPEERFRLGRAIIRRNIEGLDEESIEGAAQMMGAKRVAIRVKADDIVSWDHRKLGGVY